LDFLYVKLCQFLPKTLFAGASDKEILEKFNKIVKPYFMKIQSNKNQSRTLEKLRDTLLPKLMSGQIRVKI